VCHANEMAIAQIHNKYGVVLRSIQGSGQQPWSAVKIRAWQTKFQLEMSKAFTRESETDDDNETPAAPLALPTGVKNYITPAGFARLRAELMNLLDVERPKVVDVVSWAAKNGDRSENGDYLYGKKRLREIDRRIYFLTKRLELAEVVDPSVHFGRDQVFFGATVTYADTLGVETTITIKGVDEFDSAAGEVSWIAPAARALLKAKVGDEVSLTTPGGQHRLEVMAVSYPAPSPTVKA
jgi:transcription elongation factor GreB